MTKYCLGLKFADMEVQPYHHERRQEKRSRARPCHSTAKNRYLRGARTNMLVLPFLCIEQY